MSKDYKTLSFFKRGQRRTAVLKALTEPKTPKEIAIECKMSISKVSNALAELLEEKYVKCLNPEAHTYKYYELTADGKRARKMLEP